uniref:Calpain, small subunit 1 a n=1 Tax=Neolamprologus brichardi TaxID=32507 RepID=A0A3Q4GT77_NEOBR
MEVSPNELMNILNRIIAKHQDLKTDGFSIESCRSMVAVMDVSFPSLVLSFIHIFFYPLCSRPLPSHSSYLGFPLNGQLYQMIIRRYSDENGNMDFDNYIGCLVRLDAMCRAFKTLDKDNNGTIKVNVQEWLQLTMYS